MKKKTGKRTGRRRRKRILKQHGRRLPVFYGIGPKKYLENLKII